MLGAFTLKSCIKGDLNKGALFTQAMQDEFYQGRF